MQGSTFGERLVAAMFAAGITTPEQIAKTCGVNGRTAVRYMTLEKADLSADIAYKLARGLNVRMGWLVAGELPVRLSEEALHAIKLLEKMNDVQVRRWLRSGERVVDTGA